MSYEPCMCGDTECGRCFPRAGVVPAVDLRRLRGDRTRANTAVRSTMRFCLEGDVTGAAYVDSAGLPSWWPFWSDVLKDNTRKLWRAAKQLAEAEGMDTFDAEA